MLKNKIEDLSNYFLFLNNLIHSVSEKSVAFYFCEKYNMQVFVWLVIFLFCKHNGFLYLSVFLEYNRLETSEGQRK